ncbi:hypothetical protein E5676_scaffold155G00590 [Cucumis melo var. makuwa]|uniref:Uncharacterized protein n=1 Tax=Cucumis melo var. makuwa TaxID=1194695 RepID=A0A5D3BTQ7_CUCMM|nr:hypothetical protein E6C27_scaffold57G00740 [Cucumis melo var. makuwa]TYK02358.1 hypothetical protein E5676_scaffold155G00590 [Cucumis melo var. makuwa]
MSSNPHDPIGQNAEESMFYRFSQRLVAHFTPYAVNKRFGIERLKALGATTFEGTTNPANVEKWLSLIEKYFGVMKCSVERGVKLATILLQGSVEDWWTFHTARVRGMDSVS